MSFEIFMSNITRVLPRLRSHIQLAGFLFAVFAAALLQWVDPGNSISLALAGIVGLALVAVPLSFRDTILRKIPKNQRAPFLLILLLSMVAALVFLAAYTFDRVQQSMAAGARFDSTLQTAKFISLPNGKHFVDLDFSLFPLQKLASTMFTGIVTLHDASKLDSEDRLIQKGESCATVPSCLGYSLVHRPVFIPASGAIKYSVSIPVRSEVGAISVYWEFYQEEGDEGAKCGFRRDQPRIAEGVDPVAMYRRDLQIHSVCHVSTNTLLIYPQEKY